jgi:hypothetical protein
MASLAGSLGIVDLVGHDTVLWQQSLSTGFSVTAAFNELAQCVERERIQVLIVDGISDTFGGNENARTDVKRYVNALLSLIPADDGALLLLGHVAKPTAANGATTEGYSGSTGWHNAARARWYLYRESDRNDDEGERTCRLLLELQKSNVGRMDQSVTFAWDAEAQMLLAVGTFGTTLIDRKHRDETERLGIVRALAGCAQTAPAIIVPAALQGPRTAFQVLSKRPEFPDGLRASTAFNRRRFWSHVETLRQMHWLEECEYRRSNRHPGAEFVLTTEGVRQCAV